MLETILLIILISTLASLVRATFGFGDGLIGMPLLLIFFSLIQADIISCIYGIFIGLLFIVKYGAKYKVLWKEVALFVLFSIPGIYVGTKLVMLGYSKPFEICLAIILIAYPLVYLRVFRFITLKFGFLTWLVAFFDGFLAGSVNANGPLAVVYCQTRKFKPELLVMFLQPIFLIGNLLTASLYITHTANSKAIWIGLLLALPFIYFSLNVGKKIRQKIGDKFDIVMAWVICLAGVMLFISNIA